MSDLSSVGRAVFDESFGDRVRALLRARPVADAADNATRQSWGAYGYDVVTLALAAIDTVIARQGFDNEVTYDEVVAGLGALAANAQPERPVDEHDAVARYVVDALLNRRDREAPYRYQISVFSRDPDGSVRHKAMPAEFRLLTEYEDHARAINVLRASTDAIKHSHARTTSRSWSASTASWWRTSATISPRPRSNTRSNRSPRSVGSASPQPRTAATNLTT